ncbi:MAG TPA: hypothetical protein VMD97_13415 [Candidatus Aquilonibacter sp.]|nr:hypothetical protein [Candidatus Aquilonibacter sp.]
MARLQNFGKANPAYSAISTGAINFFKPYADRSEAMSIENLYFTSAFTSRSYASFTF